MERIVLFDGVCNFCNGSVNFIIARDKAKLFRFAPLQSEMGKALRESYDIGDDIDSVVLIEGDEAYTHSDAAIQISRGLGSPWSLAYGLVVVPDFIRDGAYELFAKYRYKMFGKKDVCMIPTPEIRERFLGELAGDETPAEDTENS